MEQIMQGARLGNLTQNADSTDYNFEDVAANLYKTIKIWRGGTARAESWVMQDCTFSLAWNLTAGEKATITVAVAPGQVTYDDAATWPNNIAAAPATAYGTQLGAAPILQSALAKFDNQARGFQSGTVAVEYAQEEFPDCNVPDGITSSAASRTVSASLDWIVNTVDDDYDGLTKTDAFTGNDYEVIFNIGQAAEDPANCQQLYIPHLQITNESKVDSTKAVRTLDGYAVTGATAPANEEFWLSSY
jgi:hypothetical protein